MLQTFCWQLWQGSGRSDEGLGSRQRHLRLQLQGQKVGGLHDGLCLPGLALGGDGTRLDRGLACRQYGKMSMFLRVRVKALGSK